MLVECLIRSPIGVLQLQANDEAVVRAVFVQDAAVEITNSANHPLLQLCIRQLQEYFSGQRKQFSLPLQQPGTSFQQKVWQQLQTIPYGSTVSYQALAKHIGDAKAIRAVGTTNGKNQLAIIVPCHRVIGSNGQLTGYAGGLWRKQWLLEHEARLANGVQRLF